MTSSYATADQPPWNSRPHAHRESAPTRTSYEVDKDRIVHCETFRSLQYKTQVQPIVHRSDRHFRTRLNHVIEVAQIARGIARSVGADEFLAEAVALAHDLGHPPFGHAGERALRRLLAASGHAEWNANVHSLAVVDSVERSHIRHRGLNLTWATREGIARHATPFDEPVSFGEFAKTPNGGIECQIVDAADVIAYLSHDVDDALAGEFFTIDEVAQLDQRLEELVGRSYEVWEAKGRALWPAGERDALLRKSLVSRLVAMVIASTAEETLRRLHALGEETSDAVRSSRERVVASDEPVELLIRRLLEFLTARYYRSDKIARADNWGEEVVYLLFSFLIDHPDYVPERFAVDDPALAVAHYLISLDDVSAGRLAQEIESLS
ncbi:MAG TPA: HD domain-containing protein [Actinomycetota bacterium]|nr:HD domain-containing protein [Actinomycetota bacterium]